MKESEAAALCRTWGPDSLAYFYEWMQREEGFRLPDHLYPVILALCDSRIDNLMLQVGPGSSKSTLLSIIYPAWVIGHDPTMTTLGISGAQDLAAGFMNAVGRMIDQNPAYRAAFPNVKPDKDRGWSNERGLFVTGRPSAIPDASFYACGMSSKALTGKHAKQIILDDLHDADNSASEAQCQVVSEKWVSQLRGRADVQGARFILAGRRWHEADLYGRLQFNGEFVCMTLPAERPGSRKLWFDITVPEGIECVFTDGMLHTQDGDLLPFREPPAYTTIERNGLAFRKIEWVYGEDYMDQGFFWPWPDHPQCLKRGPGHEPKRKEYFTNKLMEPAKTQAVYQCDPSARQGTVFIDSDFERRYVAPADLALGLTSPETRAFCRQGQMIVQAWDTAFSASTTSDYTVGVTLLLVPCTDYHAGEDPAVLGECEPHYDVYVLDILRERLTFADLSAKVRELYLRWQPARVVMEKKAYGVTVIETLENAGIPMEPIMPSSLESKRARAVEGVGAGSVQGWCRSHRVLLPAPVGGAELPWVDAFIKEAKDFTGAPGGRDDQVDSFVYGVTWAIRNGGNFVHMPDNLQTEIHPENRGFGGLDLNALAGGPRPFGQNQCSSCRYFVETIRERNLESAAETRSLPGAYCTWHKVPMMRISSCEEHASPDDHDFQMLTF